MLKIQNNFYLKARGREFLLKSKRFFLKTYNMYILN